MWSKPRNIVFTYSGQTIPKTTMIEQMRTGPWENGVKEKWTNNTFWAQLLEKRIMLSRTISILRLWFSVVTFLSLDVTVQGILIRFYKKIWNLKQPRTFMKVSHLIVKNICHKERVQSQKNLHQILVNDQHSSYHCTVLERCTLLLRLSV